MGRRPVGSAAAGPAVPLRLQSAHGFSYRHAATAAAAGPLENLRLQVFLPHGPSEQPGHLRGGEVGPVAQDQRLPASWWQGLDRLLAEEIGPEELYTERVLGLLGDLLEGIVLHSFEGKAPFSGATLKTIKELKKVYNCSLTAADSHTLREDAS